MSQEDLTPQRYLSQLSISNSPRHMTTSRPLFLDTGSAFFVGGYKQRANILRNIVTHELTTFHFQSGKQDGFCQHC